MIKKDQHCFANISATKARIFMKFYVVVNYYLVSLYILNFKKISAQMRTCDKMCVHVYARIFIW